MYCIYLGLFRLEQVLNSVYKSRIGPHGQHIDIGLDLRFLDDIKNAHQLLREADIKLRYGSYRSIFLDLSDVHLIH